MISDSGMDGPAPIWWWAALGTIIATFAAIVYGGWIFDPAQFQPVAGAGMPDTDVLKLRCLEALSLAVAAACMYGFLIRPWVKTGEVPLTGLILVGTLVGYVFDTTINYTHYVMAWNAYSINFGTWGGHFPGHTGPVRYAEGLLWGPSMYMYFGLLLGLIQQKVIDVSRKRIGLPGAFGLSFGAAFLFDFILESLIIRTTQAYAYPHIVPALSAFVGDQAQFPLYASFWVACYSSLYLAYLSSARRGPETFVDRGAASIPLAFRLPVRFLAAIGFAVVPILVYFGGMAVCGLFAQTTVSLPTYLLPSAS